MNKRKLLFASLLLMCANVASALDVVGLRVMTQKNPQGIDDSEPCFSWKLESDERSVVQTSYRIVVTDGAPDGSVVWDSGVIESSESSNVPAAGITLQPSTRYYWTVTVKDNKGNEARSSEQAYFDTGLMNSGWSGAKWIKASDDAYGTITESVKNYTVEADFEIEHTAAGLCFGKTGDGNFYMWQISTKDQNNPVFRPHVWNNGTPALITELSLKEKIDVRNGETYHLRIEITNDGHRVTTYINDVMIDERDGNFPYGDVGIRQDYGDYDMQPEIAYFDNIKVTTASDDVLFSEDFSQSNKFSAGEVVDGRLYVVGSTQQSVYAWQLNVVANLRYTVETDMTLVRDNAAIVFGATSNNTYYMWQINTSDEDYPLLRRHVYNNSTTPWHEDIKITAFSKDELIGHERHIKIDVDANVIRTYIDDQLVDTYEDKFGILAKGDLGLRVDNTSENVKEEAYFDNLKMTEYDGDGNPVVTFFEDFEGESSDYFYNPEIVVIDGNRKCHMHVTGAEYRMMQDATYSGAPMFRKNFTIEKKVKSAKLYTSALGVYNVFVNGKRVGHLQPDGTTIYEELKPGWTDYRKRVFYQSHDVTSLFVEGKNTLGAIVTSGWWAGAIAKGIYGSPETGFIAKLVITYDDNTTDVIVTDETWASSKKGAVKSGDIYDGEVYDARIVTDWNGSDIKTWNAVAENTGFNGIIEAEKGPFVKVLDNNIQTVKTATIYEGTVEGSGDYGMINVVSKVDCDAPVQLKKGQSVIFDFGQNFAGWVEFKVNGKRSTRLHLRFAEMLNDTGEKSRANDGPGGSLYRANLRSAKAELYYTMSGEENETYSPTNTFYGFRYCELTPTDDVEIVSIKGVPISSSHDDIGSISTDNEMVNRLISNIIWGQRSNLISVPTDCPQRDERLGWTADTQVFSNTAMYNSNVSAFYQKWMTDVRDGQREDGAYYDIAPVSWTEFGNGAWADAGVIVPWNVYVMSGNKKIIEDNYDSMEKFMTWLSTQQGEGYLYQGGGIAHGDWLSFATTDPRYVSVAYYAYDAQLMAKMSRVLSKSENDEYAQKAVKYETLFNNIKDEFQKRFFIASTGALMRPTQTACLLALNFKLYKDENQYNYLTKRLESLITSNGDKLNTGFVGTAVINTTLSDNGLTDKAYNLLLQRECPSWLYSIDQGATTMWERWDSYTKEKGFGDAAMNSFNHYAYGAVGEWMYRNMAGIGVSEENPGFKHIVLRPNIDSRQSIPEGQERINKVDCSYDSNYGKIVSSWTASDGVMSDYNVVVPANTTATLYLPVLNENTAVYENGTPIADVDGIEFVKYENGMNVYNLGSGSYHFTTDVSNNITEINTDVKVSVYPNPVKDRLYLSCNEEISKVNLCSMSGNIVKTINGSCSSIDVSDMAAGVYLLNIWCKDGVHTTKVIKQ